MSGTFYEIRCGLQGEGWRVVGSSVECPSFGGQGRFISWRSLDGLRRAYILADSESCFVAEVER